MLKKTVGPDDPERACDFVALHGALSKQKVKDAMNKGALWLQRKKNKRRRLRRAATVLKKGDVLELYYDSALLSRDPPRACCLADEAHYSIWYKPPGLLTQGTNFGDHCSLLRQAELFFELKRPVHPVHRLDREASGLVILAHSGDAAGRLSRLFLAHEVVKRYEVVVVGDLRGHGAEGKIDLPLDGKDALTEYWTESYDAVSDTTIVHAAIRTGRLHQIRRHFCMIGFPVMGDPRYGKGNKNSEGMKVNAILLKFRSPFSGKSMTYDLRDYPPSQ